MATLTGGVAYFGTPDGGWTEIGTVDSISLEFEPAGDEPWEPFASWSTSRTFSASFKTSRLSLAAYWALFRRRHPRARAMHCAYSQRLRARRRRGAR